MLRHALALVLLLAPVVGAGQGLPEDCSFDQAGIASDLEAIAARNPGGRMDLADRRVEWTLASGDRVRVARGGCYDLGVTISITFAAGHRPPKAIALERLLATVSTYWSARDAKAIAAELAAQGLQLESLANGDQQLEASSSAAFFQGFTILMSGDEISVSWMSG